MPVQSFRLALQYSGTLQGQQKLSLCSGGWHNCALLLASGGVKCWGAGGELQGRLGYGSEADVGSGPGEMGEHLPFVDLAAGATQAVCNSHSPLSISKPYIHEMPFSQFLAATFSKSFQGFEL